MSEETFIGEPVFGDNKANRRPNADNANWKIDREGSHHYRVLPPCGLLASSGRWSFYEAIHWGVTLSNGKKRPFRCIQRKNRKTGMVEQECPLCTKIAEQALTYENRKKELESQGKTKEEVDNVLEPLAFWLKSYNLEKAHFLNVMRPDMQIGRLKIKIKCKQNLDIVFKKLIDEEGINPISAKQGVLVDFQRSGMGRNDTTYPVSVVMENFVDANGKKMKAIKEFPLTDEVLKRMEKEAFELATYYKELSYDQIRMIVGSGFDPQVADSIFGAPKMEASPITPPNDAVFEDEPEDEPVQAKVATVTSEEDDEAKLLAQLAKVRASKSAPVARTPATPKPEAKAKVSTELDTADFISAFNSGKL